MKTPAFITIGALLLSPAFAIEAPEDNTPPPAAVNAAEPPAAPADHREAAQSAFLGVITTNVPEMFAGHLGLQPGKGVIVRSLVPDSPAANGGITENDIITHFNNTEINSAEDLFREVSALKPGDTATIGIIHNGKPGNADVVLAKRPADLTRNAHAAPLNEEMLEGIPKEFADRILGMIEGNLGDFDMDPQALKLHGFNQAIPDMEDALREMQDRMRKAMGDADALQIPPAGVQLRQNATTIRLMDNEGSIEVKSIDGAKEVTIRDKDNNVTWEGPWDTEQDKAAAPAKVRERLNNLDLDTKQMQLRFGDE
ncbi:MAG: S1C family serine protease [Verrucomicrobiota bacterium JB025]|nr:PDZ domain-containing protein [Verrucomicrobiota bacterium JB025]